MKKLLSLITLIALLCSMSLPVLAADKAIGATLRLEKTEGTVAVKNASGKAQSVKASMRLYSGYTTKTEKKSYAYISLDDSKVVKLDALSEVEVQQSGKKLEVMLSKGSLMFDVSEKLKSDESLNIRTSTMLTGVRGTIGIVTVRGITVDLSKYDKVVLENGDIMYLDKLTGKCVFLLKGNGELYQSADGSTQNVTLLGNVGNTRNQNVLSISATDIYLLEGELEVKTISGQTVTLTAGQKATVDQVDGTGEVIIRIDEAKLTDTNGSAQMMIADSPEIQQRLSEGGVYTPEQVKEAVENAPEALKREQAEQEAAYEEPTQRDKSVVPAFEDNTPESGGGGTYASTVTLDNPSEQDVRDALAAYTVVNVTNASIETTANLDIPDGKTLNLKSGTLKNGNMLSTNVNGTLVIADGATFDNSDDAILNINSTKSVHVRGTLDNAGNSTINVGVAEGDEGKLVVYSSGQLKGTETSVIYVNSRSTFEISGTSINNLGNLTVSPNATVINNGSEVYAWDVTNSGELVNNGKLELESSCTTQIKEGASFENNGTFITYNLNATSAALTNSGTITADYSIGLDRSTMTNHGTITASESVELDRSTMTNYGTITIGTQMTLENSSQYIGEAGSTLKITNSTVYCNSGCEIDLNDDAELSVASTLWVAGTVNAASDTTLTCGILNVYGGTMNSAGKLEATNGPIYVQNSGLLNIATGCTLAVNNSMEISGGSTLVNYGTITNNSMIQNDGTLTNNGTITNYGTINGTVTGTAPNNSGDGTYNP